MGLRPSYKPMEITLIRRDKSKTYLRNTLGLSPATIAKMSNGEFVSLSVIARLCEDLDCRIEEIVEFVNDCGEKDDKTKGEYVRNSDGYIPVRKGRSKKS